MTDNHFDIHRPLFLGDVHGHVSHIRDALVSALGQGVTFDALVQLGDFGVWPGPNRYLSDVSEMATKLGVPFFFIGGNHEDYDQINSWDPDGDEFYQVRPNLYYIPRGTRWVWGTTRFGALGGGFSVDYQYRIAGESWWPIVEEVQVQDLTVLGPETLDILIGHDTGVAGVPHHHWKLRLPRDTEMRSAVSQALTQVAIDYTTPYLFLHGHWHVAIDRTVDGEGRTRFIGASSLDSGDEVDQTWFVVPLDEKPYVPVFGKGWSPQA